MSFNGLINQYGGLIVPSVENLNTATINTATIATANIGTALSVTGNTTLLNATVTSTVSAARLTLTQSVSDGGNSTSVVVNNANTLKIVGSGAAVLDSINSRGAFTQLVPTLTGAPIPASNVPVNWTAAGQLVVDPLCSLYRLNGIIDFNMTSPGAGTGTFYLSKTPTGAYDSSFALNYASAPLATGDIEVLLDLYAYSATPVAALYLCATNSGAFPAVVNGGGPTWNMLASSLPSLTGKCSDAYIASTKR